jgi:hypothetical protein
MEENGYKVGHSSIMYGYNQAKKMIEQDSDYKNFINQATKDADTD